MTDSYESGAAPDPLQEEVNQILAQAMAPDMAMEFEVAQVLAVEAQQDRVVFMAVGNCIPIVGYLISRLDEVTDGSYTAFQLEMRARKKCEQAVDAETYGFWNFIAVVSETVTDISDASLIDEVYRTDEKAEVQVKIMQNGDLSEALKSTLLTVADELIPGQGLDMNDPDEYLHAVNALDEKSAMLERVNVAQQVAKQRLSELGDFLKDNHVHPEDPAWAALTLTLSVYARGLAAKEINKDSLRMLYTLYTKENVTKLGLTEEHLSYLFEIVEQL